MRIGLMALVRMCVSLTSQMLHWRSGGCNGGATTVLSTQNANDLKIIRRADND